MSYESDAKARVLNRRRCRGREGREANLLELDTPVELIQALIPIGLEAVNEVLQREVCRLTGEHYRREGGVPGYARWGSQQGSVFLADQKVAIPVPRVRDTRRGQEIPLSAYQALQDPRRVRLGGATCLAFPWNVGTDPGVWTVAP